MEIIGYGKEGEVTYLVKYRCGRKKEYIVTITEEERETLRTDYPKKSKTPTVIIDPVTVTLRGTAYMKDKKRDYLSEMQERIIKRDVFRKEWDEKCKKGKSFWAKLRLHNPYYVPSERPL